MVFCEKMLFDSVCRLVTPCVFRSHPIGAHKKEASEKSEASIFL